MPKIIDPVQRRREVTEAVFRIVRRDGLQQASLRNIAAEAGLAIGSVRHYFADHGEVMTFAVRTLAEQTSRRVLDHVALINDPPAGLTRDRAVERLLEEFLPLDEQRRLECTAWLEFVTASRTSPQLRDYALTMHEGMRMIVRRVLERGRESGRLSESVDIDTETEHFAAVLDGLCMTMLVQPDALDADRARAVLRRHLDSLRDDSDGTAGEAG